MKRMTLVLGALISCSCILAACSGPSGGTGESSAGSSAAPAAIAQDNGRDSSESGENVSEKEAYHKITAEEAKEMMDAGGVTIVDVRTAEEYAQKHIPGAILVPNEEIGEEAPKELPDQEAVLLIHCRTGIRSKQASDKLVKLGYKNVYDFGGIVDWPYDTESGAGE